MSTPDRANVRRWALYDFGSSAFNTLVVTFIYSRFFADVIVTSGEAALTVCTTGDTVGAILWTRAINVSALIVAVLMPVLGAVADYSGRKKLFLVGFALQAIVFTCLLFFVGPGQATAAILLFVIANVGFEAANVFYNAFLPEIATKETMGRVSGYGFFLGYIGGMICLVFALGMVTEYLPGGPWLPGGEAAGYLNVRATLLLVAVWFTVFSLPLFLGLEERAERRSAGVTDYARIGFGRLANTLHHLRDLREAAKLLLARMIYNDGLVTVISLAAIYAGAVLGIGNEFILIAIALNVAAGLGAWAFGFVDDRIGGKKTLIITLVGLTLAGIVGVTWTSIAGFWVAATVIGIMMGPNQSASRSLFAKLVPEHKHGEMFGLFAFSGKMSSLLGPLAYGTVLSATCDHRLAMGTIVLFFVVGLGILAFVREEEGIRLAQSLHEEYTATNARA